MILTVLLTLTIIVSPLESFFLPVAQAVSPNSDIGLVTWFDVGQTIDLSQAKSLFTTISSESANEIEGTYSVYFNNYNVDEINLYVSKSGLIAVYHNGNEPAAKMVLWESDKLFYYTNIIALATVGKSLGYTINAKDVNYYDYRYPNANRILIVAQSVGESVVQNFEYGSFDINIPNYATVYETSYSIYLNDIYSTQSTATLAIDGTVIGSVIGNGAIYNSYNGFIEKDVSHIIGVMSNQGTTAAATMIILYKDDNLDSANLNTILATNYEYQFSREMVEPIIPTTGTTVTTYVPTTIPTPKVVVTPEVVVTPDVVVPEPTRIKVKIPTPKQTVQETEVIPEWTVEPTEKITPKPTKDASKPPKVSVDLHGERTNIELGQQSLLKGSIVSFNTNKDKMHAQVIIIPPSGVSVVAADFVKTIAGQYTSDFDLDPGKGKDIEVTIIPNEVGEFKVTSKVTYYFGEDKDDNGYEEIRLDIKTRPKGSSGGSPAETTNIGQTTQPISTPKEQPGLPGFEILSGITILIICFFLIKKN